MVGAGRFERPTPCAQGRFRPRVEIDYFLMLTFQADTAGVLRLEEARGNRRLWQLHFRLHRQPTPNIFLTAPSLAYSSGKPTRKGPATKRA
jgi:hypothetical protein